MTSLTIESNTLVVQTRYDASFVAALKAQIPPAERKYDPTRRVWITDPRHGDTVAKLIQTYLGEFVFVPQVKATTQSPELRAFEVRYIGITKARPGYNERTAFGFSQGSWNVVFPESVLLAWFTGLQELPESALTFYGTLGINRQASQDEIKTAFRRLARQWHPDVCKEPNAHEQFIAIKRAADILQDTNLRARYDAGLALEESLKTNLKDTDTLIFSSLASGYRTPYRCGYILAEGLPGLSFTVQKILQWEDIYNSRGQMLVVSWPAGAKEFTEDWV